MTLAATVAYYADGNTLSDAQGRTFTWDFENRLTQVVNPGVGTTTFRYDPFGRRIQKSGPLGTTNYLYDGADVVEELDGGGVLARYTRTQTIDEPLAEIRSGTTSYYQTGGLGSTTSLTNSSATIVASYAYDAFGNLSASTGSITNPFRYTGRESDSETGLYYYRARYYDPQSGRFISEDPIRFGAGVNFYDYVLNRPTRLFDPSGECFDINNFVATLNGNAGKVSRHKCGLYVGLALRAGGADVGIHNGKDYGPYLPGGGFYEVSADNYVPQIGDIAVIQPYPGGNSAGHVEGFNGTNWVSDFQQVNPGGAGNRGRGFWPGPGYRQFKPPYVIYRPSSICESNWITVQDVAEQVPLLTSSIPDEALY